MNVVPFATEEFFARYEFTCPHNLSASDCETVSIGKLCEIAQQDVGALDDLSLGYSESFGTPSLRAAIASSYEDVSPDEVLVLGAPAEGIYLTMRAILQPGDRVIVLSPHYDSLANVAVQIGCEVIRVGLRPTGLGWTLDQDEFRSACTPNTKLCVLNFPHNPTGYLPTATEFHDLATIVQRTGAWLFSDEMYRGLEYQPDQQLPSGCSLGPRCITLGGLSKAQGLPGLRSGWLVVKDRTMRDAIHHWKHYTTICAAAPAEFLARIALGASDALVARSLSQIQSNLALVERFFERHSSRFVWRAPAAGSVALVQLPGEDVEALSHRLASEAGIVLLPGACLGADPDFARIGLGRSSFPSALAAFERWLSGNA